MITRLLMAAVLATAAPAPVAPQRLCTVEDPRLAELSGLVVQGDAFWAMPDGGSARRLQIYRLDPRTCAITATRTAATVDPFDPEDLALGPDGAIWVADMGDNDRTRATVAMVVMPARGQPAVHRLTYPDGPHDAEALLVDAAGRPVIVTKEGDFGSGIYRTQEPPQGNGPTPLVRLGTFTLPTSDGTSGPLGALGSRLVTGAAASPDGHVVAIRSYTDAWLYAVRDSDVVAALSGPAVRVPLPGEPQGEAIAFDAGGALYSGSETRGGVPGELRKVPGAEALVGDGTATVTPAATAQQPEPAQTSTWLPAAIGGAVVIGALTLLGGAMALRGRRRG